MVTRDWKHWGTNPLTISYSGKKMEVHVRKATQESKKEKEKLDLKEL